MPRRIAVRWRSLDLEIGTLPVRESVYEGKFQSPKTQKSRRTIPLGPQSISWLREHRLRAGRTPSDDLVFGNRNGQPMRESKLLTKVLQPAAKAAGLGRVTWHQFRHIHSSLLNDLRVPVKIAQEQLGHSSISTTLNIYTSVLDASHRKAIEALERELFPSVPQIAGWPQGSQFGNSLFSCGLGLEAPPGFEPGWRFYRQGRDVNLVDSSCFLVGPTPSFSLVFGRCCSQIVPKFGGSKR
jgi:hypothetical protein